MSPAEIAARLTPAQRKAVMAVSATHYQPLKRAHSKALGSHLRYILLMQDGNDYTMSDLGLAVRAVLEREPRDG